MAEGLLAEVGNAATAEGGRTLPLQQRIVVGSPVNRQRDDAFAALDDRLAGRLLGIDGQPRQGRPRSIFGEVPSVDDHSLKLPAQCRFQRRHRPGPSSLR